MKTSLVFFAFLFTWNFAHADWESDAREARRYICTNEAAVAKLFSDAPMIQQTVAMMKTLQEKLTPEFQESLNQKYIRTIEADPDLTLPNRLSAPLIQEIEDLIMVTAKESGRNPKVIQDPQFEKYGSRSIRFTEFTRFNYSTSYIGVSPNYVPWNLPASFVKSRKGMVAPTLVQVMGGATITHNGKDIGYVSIHFYWDVRDGAWATRYNYHSHNIRVTGEGSEGFSELLEKICWGR